MKIETTESRDVKLCCDVCEKCALAADLCAVEDARRQGPARSPLAVLCADVAAACRATAAALVRESEQHPLFCALTAQVCRLCADACAERGSEELYRACHDACIACADECARHAVEAVPAEVRPRT